MLVYLAPIAKDIALPREMLADYPMGTLVLLARYSHPQVSEWPARWVEARVAQLGRRRVAQDFILQCYQPPA